MPALLLLLAAIGLNYGQHKAGRPTICSTLRRLIGPELMVALWSLLTAWFLRHYVGGFARVVEALDDTRPEIEEIP